MDIKVRLALLERIFDVTPDMVFIKDVNGVYLYVSPAFATMAGFDSADEIIGHNDSEVFAPIYAKRFVAIDKLVMDTLQDRENYKERLPDDENGRERYCMTSKYVLKNEMGIELDYDFIRMPYEEAMNRFGSDKPDIRFGFELKNLSDILAGTEFKVFAGALAAGGKSCR